MSGIAINFVSSVMCFSIHHDRDGMWRFVWLHRVATLFDSLMSVRAEDLATDQLGVRGSFEFSTRKRASS